MKIYQTKVLKNAKIDVILNKFILFNFRYYMINTFIVI